MAVDLDLDRFLYRKKDSTYGCMLAVSMEDAKRQLPAGTQVKRRRFSSRLEAERVDYGCQITIMLAFMGVPRLSQQSTEASKENDKAPKSNVPFQAEN